MSNSTPTERILRLAEVKRRIGLSRSAIYDRLNPRSPRYDESFPRPLRLGPKAVGWQETRIQAWIESLPTVNDPTS